MKYGYARVSTLGQATNGNSLEAQKSLLKKEGVEEENLFVDIYTGTRLERPKFSNLLNVLGQGDILIVTKLDRFARSLLDGLTTINGMLEKGVRVHILDLGVLDNTPTSTLTRNILLAIAEFERGMIVERMQSGKAIARQREDYKEGRPKKFTKNQLIHALELKKIHSYKQVEDMTGISKSTLIRAKNVENSKFIESSIEVI